MLLQKWYPTGQKHVTVSQPQVSRVFFLEIDRCSGTEFRFDRILKPGYYSGGEGGGT